MSEAFLKVVNMSISAGWLVLAVLALRLILKKAPKWVNVLLWGIVAIKLICPFSIESALSLIPSRETISPEIMMDWTPEISTGIAPLDQVVNPVISTSFAPNPGTSANPLQILIPVAANLWLLGVIIMLVYTAISYLTLRRKLRTAVILRGNIFQCETVSSPFVLGIVKPRIYLPYTMDSQNLRHVVAHEQAHIRRKDHWWKPLGFLLLTVYWFNPLMWVAYILLCRDIELACDEKVIAELGNEQRADYTQALVACAVNRRMIAACPLAFGEVGVKDRIKSIMNYRRPTFWIIVTALVVCVVVAVCFLTDPNPSREFSMNGNNVSGLNPEAIVERILDIEDITNSGVHVNTSNFPIQVDSNFNWNDSQTVSYFFKENHKTYNSQLRIYPEEDKYFLTEPDEWPEQQEIFLLRHYLEAIKYLPQYEIQQMAPADQYIIQHVANGRPSDYERVITYSSDGIQELTGWFIHLQIQPLHTDGEGYSGSGDEVIELFYGDSNGKYSEHAQMWFDFTAAPNGMSHTDEMKCTINEFKGITFKYTPHEIVASTSWENSATEERQILISGMPIWNAYFCDLTGDSLPEICSQVSFGSGIIDNRVIVFDYANGVSYSLIDRGYHDYYLRMNDADGYLYVDKRIYNSDEVVSSGRLVFKDGCIQVEGVSSLPALQEYPISTADKIMINHSNFPGDLAVITEENPEVLNEILSMYDSLKVEKYSRPLSEERLILTFYRGEDIIEEWTVSYYAEDDTIVTCSDGFGLGNRRVTNDFSYNRLQRIFEDYAFTMIFCYEPLGVSGNNVEELSRISDHVKWIDGLGIDELAPGEEIVSDFVIDVEEDGTDLLITITWGAQDLVLKYGIRAEDGTEFFQEKPGGSSTLRMKDIPAGTYRLFVRNSEAYAGIPAYENPEKFPDVSFNATGAILYAFDN